MSLELKTAPAHEPVSVAEAKLYHGIDTVEHDALIAGLITAARAHVERETRLALVTQTFELKLEDFPSDGEWDSLYLLRPPLQSVAVVRYVDNAGQGHTLEETTDYVLDSHSEDPRLLPAFDKTWPAARKYPGSVIVQFVSGYGAADPDDPEAWIGSPIPEPLRLAILMIVGHWYENREAASEANVSLVPLSVDALLAPYRYFRK